MKKLMMHHRLITAIMAFVLVALAYGGIVYARGDHYVMHVNYVNPGEFQKVEVTFDGKKESDILDVAYVVDSETNADVCFSAKARGSEEVEVNAYFHNNGEVERIGTGEKITVGAGHFIINNQKQYIYLAAIAFAVLMLIYYTVVFVFRIRRDKYSYDTVFVLAAALFFLFLLVVWTSATIYSMVNTGSISSTAIATVNENIALMLVGLSLPLVLIFAVSVSVSNLALMKHEGVRPVNALGIAVSFIMILGLCMIGALLYLSSNYHSAGMQIAASSANALYVMFEVVLFSTIFCSIYAAKKKPSPDKEYIIILGCKIREDGTLYPLIQGRADAAIRFYQEQLEKTGKKAYFIPSGGQGEDETVSEGRAVADYLISRGIPEDQILPETESTTTYENMNFSKNIVCGRNEYARVAFATTNYHVFRSGIIAGQAGLDAEGIGADTKWYFWPNALLREVAGLFVSQPKKQLLIAILVTLLAALGEFGYSLI